MGSFAFYTIKQITSGIRNREFRAREVLEWHKKRIAELQPQLNAFVHLDFSGAEGVADRVDAAVARGDFLGRLAGVPVSVKSCIDVAGWPCPAGSLLRKGYVASNDAPLVGRLRAAGAVLVGNTNTPEFLMAYETNNRLSGPTSNPWSLAHSAGGSSGGEAAAIASGCSMGGVGSDGGGSIRVPAHFCGICGLKPTPGRVPITGHFPAGGGAFAWLGAVGPMARTIEDLETLFSVIAGPDPGDPLAAPTPARSVGESEVRGLRVGILESDALGAVTPETEAAVQQAARWLGDAGFCVEPFRMQRIDRALELWWYFFGTVIAHLLQQSIAGREDEIGPMLSEYLEVAGPRAPLSLDEFLQNCGERDTLRTDLIRQMSEVPILISAVSSAPAFRHGEGSYREGSGYRDTMRHSQWLNPAGFPGVSVPVGLCSQGLPIGVQVIARPFEDELALAVGRTIERARGTWQAPQLGEQHNAPGCQIQGRRSGAAL
jgi:Asp-tRNA(Asn)/Glu-tRNA(Gln) amidotransferase A subunit family amidase